MRTVTAVIPGRNCAATLKQCLDAITAIRNNSDALREIIFVDDGSADETTAIANSFKDVKVLRGEGRGAGSARNIGWRAATHPLVWFVDADCVANIDALDKLTPHMKDDTVGGVSGSYGIANRRSLLATLIHEEIISRHERMNADVDFLATFNVLYRRAALEKVDGFDERYLKGQDAELSFRVMDAGYKLRFELDSRVDHYHETKLLRYLRTQRQQGYWRAWLHLRHRGHALGDSYSSAIDHLQPVLGLLFLVSTPFAGAVFIDGWRWTALTPLVVLLLFGIAHLPMTTRLLRRTQKAAMISFLPMSMLRSIWRGVGLVQGVVGRLLSSESASK